MSNGSFIFRSEEKAPSIGSIAIRPIPVPDLPINEGLGEGLRQLGGVAVQVGRQIRAAQDATREANATTQFITAIDAAQTAAQNDPDYEGAPARFREAANKAFEDALKVANLDAEGSARLRLSLTKNVLAANGQVETDALGKNVS